jgi:AraC-like DNA-binding protein
VLIVETIGQIGREHFFIGKSIKEIARDLKISRNTVRKVLRSGEMSFSYERVIQLRPKLGRWRVEIDRMLTRNAGNAVRERLTLIRLFEELRALGYESGYGRMRRRKAIRLPSLRRGWGRRPSVCASLRETIPQILNGLRYGPSSPFSSYF